jgi:hypothetical protein
MLKWGQLKIEELKCISEIRNYIEYNVKHYVFKYEIYNQQKTNPLINSLDSL